LIEREERVDGGFRRHDETRAFSDQSENALAFILRATLSDQIESKIQSDRMLL
jgi:hypothetical protein